MCFLSAPMHQCEMNYCCVISPGSDSLVLSLSLSRQHFSLLLNQVARWPVAFLTELIITWNTSGTRRRALMSGERNLIHSFWTSSYASGAHTCTPKYTEGIPEALNRQLYARTYALPGLIFHLCIMTAKLFIYFYQVKPILYKTHTFESQNTK